MQCIKKKIVCVKCCKNVIIRVKYVLYDKFTFEESVRTALYDV